MPLAWPDQRSHFLTTLKKLNVSTTTLQPIKVHKFDLDTLLLHYVSVLAYVSIN
jgi:hypothetical protein